MSAESFALTLPPPTSPSTSSTRSNNNNSSSYAVRPYSKNGNGDNDQMRNEIVRLESVLSNRIAARSQQDPSTSSLSVERSSKIEKYVEVMELTKCLRRQKEFLLNENRKRQRFAEKVQQAMPPSTDSLQFLKNVKPPTVSELQKTTREALEEMRAYDVSGSSEGEQYIGWRTRREAQAMYLHMSSEKDFDDSHDMQQIVDSTWRYFHDENVQQELFRRRTKFVVIKKVDESMFLTRHIHQFTGESFPRHALTLVCRVSLDQNSFGILTKSLPPPASDAQHLVWTDEVSLWTFTRKASGFTLQIKGKYGSTSAVAGNRLPMLESFFQLVDWESLVVRPLFQFSS